MARGAILAIAGQIGWDDSQRLVDGGFVAQFDRALANVVRVCLAAGGAAEDIISLTIYVVDKTVYAASLKEVGASYRRHMGTHYPAMALVEVKGLLEPGALVEIQGLAVRP
jgi:enamine deaminase RidA (YjgF/YER057c/UK114 family)